LENEQLTDENQSLRNLTSESDNLGAENLKLKEQIEELSENLESLENQFPFQMAPSEKDQLKSYLEQLADYHPDIPLNLLLLGSVDTTIRTETSFWTIPTINHFLKQSKITES
jgi:septal ring factor EnvC (AmiA/AmiB activator)